MIAGQCQMEGAAVVPCDSLGKLLLSMNVFPECELHMEFDAESTYEELFVALKSLGDAGFVSSTAIGARPPRVNITNVGADRDR